MDESLADGSEGKGPEEALQGGLETGTRVRAAQVTSLKTFFNKISRHKKLNLHPRRGDRGDIQVLSPLQASNLICTNEAPKGCDGAVPLFVVGRLLLCCIIVGTVPDLWLLSKPKED